MKIITNKKHMLSIIKEVIDNVHGYLKIPYPKQVKIDFDVRVPFPHLNWNKKGCPIEIPIYYKKDIKAVIAHEYIHYLDFLKDGKWNANYTLVKRLSVYYSNYYEHKAESIAQSLYPSQDSDYNFQEIIKDILFVSKDIVGKVKGITIIKQEERVIE